MKSHSNYFFDTWLKERTKDMTSKEIMMFMQVEEYYKQRLLKHSEDFHKPLSKLVDIDAEKAIARFWELMDTVKDEALVEAQMVSEWMIPPTFKKVIFCTGCNVHVLVKSSDFATVTFCPWCSSGLYQKEIQ
jgi:hypothetical protein